MNPAVAQTKLSLEKGSERESPDIIVIELDNRLESILASALTTISRSKSRPTVCLIPGRLANAIARSPVPLEMSIAGPFRSWAASAAVRRFQRRCMPKGIRSFIKA